MYRMEFKKWLADSGTITTKKSRSAYVSRVSGAESLLRERGFADVAAFDRLPAPDEELDGLEGIVRETKNLIALPERPRAKGTLQDYVSAIRQYAEFLLEFSANAANSDPARRDSPILLGGTVPAAARSQTKAVPRQSGTVLETTALFDVHEVSGQEFQRQALGRLRTQDRWYKDGSVFLLPRLFFTRQWSDQSGISIVEAAKRQLGTARVWMSQTEHFPLPSVDNFVFRREGADYLGSVEVNSKKMELFNPENGGRFVIGALDIDPNYGGVRRWITLDHRDPLASLIPTLSGFEAMKEFSRIVLGRLPKVGGNYPSGISPDWYDADFRATVLEDTSKDLAKSVSKLLVTHVYADHSLDLMYYRRNSQKNAGT